MNKSAFYKLNPGEEKMQRIAYVLNEMLKSGEILTCLISAQVWEKNSSSKNGGNE